MKVEDTSNEHVVNAEHRALLSIAISLKRIADAMTKPVLAADLSPEDLEKMQEEWNKGIGIPIAYNE